MNASISAVLPLGSLSAWCNLVLHGTLCKATAVGSGLFFGWLLLLLCYNCRQSSRLLPTLFAF